MEILKYPHPVLRHKSKPLKKVDDELRRMIREMFDLMYEAKGIGLAANQVGLPYRMFIVNMSDKPGDAEEEFVFLNPVLSQPKGSEEAEEGCLSLPGVYQQVVRPAQIRINAYDLAGKEIDWELDGLFARVVQHETDHLDGVMFIDRLTETRRMSVKDKVNQFETRFEAQQESGAIPKPAAIAKLLAELEKKRT